jgi:hypothetical protein
MRVMRGLPCGLTSPTSKKKYRPLARGRNADTHGMLLTSRFRNSCRFGRRFKSSPPHERNHRSAAQFREHRSPRTRMCPAVAPPSSNRACYLRCQVLECTLETCGSSTGARIGSSRSPLRSRWSASGSGAGGPCGGSLVSRQRTSSADGRAAPMPGPPACRGTGRFRRHMRRPTRGVPAGSTPSSPGTSWRPT